MVSLARPRCFKLGSQGLLQAFQALIFALPLQAFLLQMGLMPLG